VKERGIGRRRDPDIHNSRPDLIVNTDKIGGIERLSVTFGDDQRHRFAHMPDTIPRQSPPWRLRHRLAACASDCPQRAHRTNAVPFHIGATENGDHACRRPRRRDIYVANGGMGVRRTDEDGMHLVRKDDVSDEAPGAAQQALIFDAANRDADALSRSVDGRVYCNSSRNRSSLS
jgi:hypothetical protein